MDNSKNGKQLAQSSSALGAAILGFGIGAKWGNIISAYAVWVIIAGAIIHVFGMYLMQMKNTERSYGVARLLWVSAWICLIGLIAIIVYLLI